jgi:chromosome segregation ATPase
MLARALASILAIATFVYCDRGPSQEQLVARRERAQQERAASYARSIRADVESLQETWDVIRGRRDPYDDTGQLEFFAANPLTDLEKKAQDLTVRLRALEPVSPAAKLVHEQLKELVARLEHYVPVYVEAANEDLRARPVENDAKQDPAVLEIVSYVDRVLPRVLEDIERLER